MRKLDEEEEELTNMISEGEAHPEETANKERLDQLKFARERVRMKKRQRPSQRDVAIETDTDATVAEAFKGRAKNDARPVKCLQRT